MGSFPTHSETDSFAFDGNDWVLGCHSVSFFGVHTQTHKDTQRHTKTHTRHKGRQREWQQAVQETPTKTTKRLDDQMKQKGVCVCERIEHV